MQIDEKIITAMAESNKCIVGLANKAIDEVAKNRKKMVTLFLSVVVSFTIIIGLFIFCYFEASYGENYQQHITQTQEINNENNILTEDD